MMWYSRDGNGDRALWIEEPTKDTDGDWTVDDCDSYALAAGDFNGDDDAIDAILGEGVHGLRKGSCIKISVSWCKISKGGR